VNSELREGVPSSLWIVRSGHGHHTDIVARLAKSYSHLVRQAPPDVQIAALTQGL
jgi:hypothetical protein